MDENKENKCVTISVEPSKKDPRLSTITLKAGDVNNFMVATLLSIQALSDKTGIDYDTMLKLFIALLKDDEVIDSALERVRAEDDDTLF